MKYTFGTGDEAAARLEDVARFFNPLTVEFVSRFVAHPVNLVLDLGCGPGHSTNMLAQTVDCHAVIGLDNSHRFLQMARDRYPQLTFLEHDVTITPFPARPEALYVRFLLSHLTGVINLVNRWLQELAPGGFLLIEELEAIDTDIAIFQRYLQITAAMVRAQGAELFAGRILGPGSYTAELLCNESFPLPVSNCQAASWFYPNTLSSWEASDHVRDNVSPRERKEISDSLRRMKESGDSRQDIVWNMRRLVLRP